MSTGFCANEEKNAEGLAGHDRPDNPETVFLPNISSAK